MLVALVGARSRAVILTSAPSPASACAEREQLLPAFLEGVARLMSQHPNTAAADAVASFLAPSERRRAVTPPLPVGSAAAGAGTRGVAVGSGRYAVVDLQVFTGTYDA